ncbi:MAG TPA: cellulase family glycosylhydrolase [Polyangia bacterium]|nr:cellulase family glycosylhydrolase [Polyangia bacterium]
MGMRVAILLLAVTCILLGAPRGTNGDPFVRTSEHDLVIDRQPFHFVGANLAVMHGPANRAATEAVIEGAAKDGLRVGRVWAFGEADADAPEWQRENYLFRAGPDGWVESGPRQLDRVIAAAGKAGLHLIITLANNWSDYGGVPRYLHWAGVRDDDAYGASDKFYSDAKARAFYRAHVERLLKRANQLTGVPYKDDPTILGWELMNESTVFTTAGAQARKAWVAEMGKLVHTLDPHHLVTPGVSVYRTESERRDWLAVCKIPEVDFCDAHLYVEDLLRNRDTALLESAFDDVVQLAHYVADKPLVVGEFGVHGDATGTWEHQTRGYWMGRILERLRFDGAAGGIVWLYQPAGGADRRHGISVGETASENTRAAIRAAAAAPAMPPDAVNPDLGANVGEVPLMPLHGEFVGKASVVPQVPEDVGAPHVTWDPTTYDLAAWEATGIYEGGALVHAWGTETGWFEYAYEIVAKEKEEEKEGGRRPRPARPRYPFAISVRARVSSEYPGTTSPPEGASDFEVTLDGMSLGMATAVRDDGRGAWIEVRTGKPDVLHAAVALGKHRLRFVVAPGPHAHGLCLYGKPGEKGGANGRSGPIDLRVER